MGKLGTGVPGATAVMADLAVSGSAVNGPEDLPDWDAIDWRHQEEQVRRLQQRIFKAEQAGNRKQVRNLQKLLLRSRANTLVSVRRVTQHNTGRHTPGVDRQVALTSESRASLAMLLHSLASPRLSALGRMGAHDFVSVARFPQATSPPGILILRPEEPLFFANADPLLAMARQRVSKQPDVRLVIFSLEESPDLDGTALESLGEFAAWLAAHNIEMRVARLKDASRDALLRANFSQLPATGLDYHSVDDAVSGSPAGAPAPPATLR